MCVGKWLNQYYCVIAFYQNLIMFFISSLIFFYINIEWRIFMFWRPYRFYISKNKIYVIENEKDIEVLKLEKSLFNLHLNVNFFDLIELIFRKKVKRLQSPFWWLCGQITYFNHHLCVNSSIIWTTGSNSGFKT